MASIGQYLKQERESKGISLKEIAEATKINQRFLSYLEDDKLDLLPGQFITRGIIRTYAKHIGLDPKTVLQNYKDETEIGDPLSSDESGENSFTEIHSSGSRKIIGTLAFILFTITIVIILYLILNKKEQVSIPPPPAKSISVPEKEAPPPPAEIQVEQEPDDLNMILKFSEETWIQLSSDGEMLINGLMQPGEEREVQAAREIVLTLGNAGGVAITINGKEARPIGISGQVVRDVTMTLENYRQFLVDSEQKER